MMGQAKVPLLSRLWLSVICMALMSMGGARAWGATCAVTSTADTNTAGTLRNCLSTLTTGAAVDTNVVTFTVTGAITLTGTLPDIENGVTITGPGANQLTIDGGGQFQAITIGNGTNTPTVSISGLTFANADAGSKNGGAIQLDTG